MYYRLMGRLYNSREEMKLIGYVIVNLTSLDILTITIDDCIRYVMDGSIVNVEYKDKKLRGKDCSIDSIPKYIISKDNLKLISNNVLTVLYVIEDESITYGENRKFFVMDGLFNTKLLTYYELLQLLGNYIYEGVNVKYVNRNGTPYIATIKGDFMTV